MRGASFKVTPQLPKRLEISALLIKADLEPRHAMMPNKRKGKYVFSREAWLGRLDGSV